MHEKSPEFISLFIDENLKKGLKGVRNIDLSGMRLIAWLTHLLLECE